MPAGSILDLNLKPFALAVGPVVALLNQFVRPVLPLAWAFERTQTNFATLTSFSAVVIGWVYVRFSRRWGIARPVTILIGLTIISTFISTLVYIGLLEWLSPNPRRLPITQLTLAPTLALTYSLPFFCLALALSILGWAGGLKVEDAADSEGRPK